MVVGVTHTGCLHGLSACMRKAILFVFPTPMREIEDGITILFAMKWGLDLQDFNYHEELKRDETPSTEQS